MYLTAFELLAAFLGMIFILAYVERVERSAGLSGTRNRRNRNIPPNDKPTQSPEVSKISP